MATIAERVQRGIDLLDEKGPKDWRDKIDITILSITSPLSCILGQTFGSFIDPICGFNIRGVSDEYGFCGWKDDSAELEAEWIRRLTEDKS